MAESLHNKFLTYLERIRVSENERIELVSFAETKLPEFIRRHFNAHFGELYDYTDRTYIEKLRNRVFTIASAKNENEANESNYSLALKRYGDFLQSKVFKGKEKIKKMENEEASSKKTSSPIPTLELIETKVDPLEPNAEHPEEELKEGRIRQVNITKHERSRELRQKCLQHYGYVCQCCGMDFEKWYGKAGKNYIEVHHMNPIANTDGEHALDPKDGLIPLCSNCHSMIHRGSDTDQPLTLEELKQIYTGPVWN